MQYLGISCILQENVDINDDTEDFSILPVIPLLGDDDRL